MANEINNNNVAPVEVPEQNKNINKFGLVREGAELGAGMAAGIAAVAGVAAGAVWLGGKIVGFVGNKVRAGKEKRAAKKAAKAEQAEKLSKKKAGED